MGLPDRDNMAAEGPHGDYTINTHGALKRMRAVRRNARGFGIHPAIIGLHAGMKRNRTDCGGMKLAKGGRPDVGSVEIYGRGATGAW